jgi:hypothetical protein
VRPAALSNPSPQSQSNKSPIKSRPPNPISHAGPQHSFVQQNQPHRIDQPANFDSSDSPLPDQPCPGLFWWKFKHWYRKGRCGSKEVSP